MKRLALLLLLAFPAAASGAYAPEAALELSTRAPGAVPAVTSTLTLPSGHNATRTVAARFPPAFTYNPGFSVPGCLPADEQAGTCPEASRVGSIEATSPFGGGEGPVHLMADLRLVGFIGAYAGLVDVRVTGVVAVLDDGSAEITFDDLPNVPSSGRISLEGGERGVLVNPRRCGAYEVGVTLTSHADERVETVVPIAVTGCPPALVVRRPRLDGRVLTWRVSEPSTTVVSLLRRGRHGWRELWRRRTVARRLRIGRLRPGRYRFELRAMAGGNRASEARSLTITRP